MNVPQQPHSFRTGPDERGHFGLYGGRFVAETLMPLIHDLEKAYNEAKNDPAFCKQMDGYLRDYVGRPSALYFAERLTAHFGGAKIYLKREDCNHTGAHKVNNVLGQILLAKRMGKPRVIAETGAGMHGVATATLVRQFGLECVVPWARSTSTGAPNVMRMKALGAEVRPVMSGSRTLKDAMNEALRDWVTNVHNTFYCIGTVAGPHPYPAMVRDFQCVIGNETRAQMQEAEGRLPDSLIACIGGGSNAMGLFHPFLDDRSVEIFGVEAAGHGLTGLHAASIAGGRPGVLHGNRTSAHGRGQSHESHRSRPASTILDRPARWLNDCPRDIPSATDAEAPRTFNLLSRPMHHPALETAHALARVIISHRKAERSPEVVNLRSCDNDLDASRTLGDRGESSDRRRHRWLLSRSDGYLVWSRRRVTRRRFSDRPT